MRQGGEEWSNLADAIDRILESERDEDALCDILDFEKSIIVHAILQGIADPQTLAPLVDAVKEAMERREES